MIFGCGTMRISIHAPSRGRPRSVLFWYIRRNVISIHAPSRGRLPVVGHPALEFANFNPRPLAGATTGCRISGFSSLDFNPRPLAGATACTPPSTRNTSISIHAPSRGRQQDCRGHQRRRPISIHAPSRGRPGCGKDCSVIPCDFNPRPLAGATVRRGSQIPSDVPVFFSRRSVFRFSKPRYPVLFLSVCFPFALTAPWGLQGRKSFWLPSAGFCSDTYCPGCRTAGCRGLCR